MEKVRVGLADGEASYWWKFREDDLELIRVPLERAGASEAAIGRLVDELEVLCDNALEFRNRLQRGKVRDQRRSLVKRCREAQEALRGYVDAKPGAELIFDDRLQYWEAEPHAYIDMTDRLYAAAMATLGPLGDLISVMEEAEQADDRKGGRDPADSDGIVREIARLYREHIHEPSSYAGGPFFALVVNVLEISGMPSNDPSRRIRAALKRPF
jgi:hypothetical protein